MYDDLLHLQCKTVRVILNLHNSKTPHLQFFGELRIELGMNGHYFQVESSIGNYIIFDEKDVEKIDNSCNLELSTVVLK